MQFIRYGLDEGLSDPVIHCLVQDSRGFLWIGTRDGLNRYDGYEFKVFKHSVRDTNSLASNLIHALLDDGASLWIGTQMGLDRYDYASSSFVHFRKTGTPGSLSDNDITSLLKDSYGRLWVGTYNGGLCVLDSSTGKFTSFRADSTKLESLRSDEVTALIERSPNRLLIGTAKGLHELDLLTNRIVPIHGSLDDVSSIAANKSSIVVGSYKTGLWKLADGRITPLSVVRQNVSALFVDNEDAVWAGTWGEGVGVFGIESGNWTSFISDLENPTSLSDDWVNAFVEDSSGNMWIGTGNGLCKVDLKPKKIRTYKNSVINKSLLLSESIYCISEDKDGILWLGGNNGVTRFDSHASSSTHLRLASSGVPGNVSSIIQDRDGVIWLSGDAGLMRKTPRGIEMAPHRHAGRIGNICEDAKDGNLWLGSAAGIHMYKPADGTCQLIPYPADIAAVRDLTTFAVTDDKKGSLWIGTYDRLFRFEKRSKSFESFRHDPTNKQSPSWTGIVSVCVSRSGDVWFASGRGLNRFNPATRQFRHYFREQGLPHNFIRAVVEDTSGNIWGSTREGLFRLNPLSEEVTSYDGSDGVQSEEFNAGSAFVGRHGDVFFGGRKGLNAFHPAQVFPSPFIPSVLITSIAVFNREESKPRQLNVSAPIDLAYDDYLVTFEFSAMDFTDPSANQYKYMMEGLDPDWREVTGVRETQYMNLPAGTYRFKVLGSNHDGVWNPVPSLVDLVVVPPYWERWWFRAGILLLVAAVAISAYRYRLNRLLEMERLRVRISSDLHDEVASNLSSIAMFSTIVNSDGEEDPRRKQLLDRITHLAQESVNSIRDIIWAIDTRQETLATLLTKLRDSTVVACQARNIEVDFDVPSDISVPMKNLDPDKRQHLWLLLKEGVNNALKHSGCSVLRCSYVIERNSLSLLIRDNGKGFTNEISNKGKGLQTMRMRALQLNGSVWWDSDGEGGTRVRIDVPI